MSVSAVPSSPEPFGWEGSLVPRLATENAATSSVAKDSDRLHMFAEGDDEASFWDFLDVINPLQHIPLVNSLYREVTGDKIGAGARLVGGTLYGGPIGLIGSALNAMLEEATGHDAGGHLIALFKDEAPKAAPTTAIADATTTAPAETKAAEATQTASAQPVLLPDMPVDTSQAPAPAATQTAAAVAQAAQTPQPPLPQAAPAAPVKTAAADGAIRAVDSAEGKPLPLLAGRQARLMPVPARTTPIATQSPPAVGTTVSNSGMRSNTPVTGARPNRPVITPAMAQEMAASQTATQTANAATGDWFSAAMMQGLSKYERNSRVGAKGAASVTEAQ